MIKVDDIFKFLCDKYPLNTALDFDNVGLLVGNKDTIVTKVLVCLDCDINALKKASELGCELIISHHPVIFEGLKNVNNGDIAYELIKSDIAVISMHTNLDIARGGVTDCLCEALELLNVKSFECADGLVIRSAKTEIGDPNVLADFIKAKLNFSVRYVAGREIENVLVCSGSGGSCFPDTVEKGFDALICADIKHNIFVDAINKGISVFDCGHYASEAVVIEPLSRLLQKEFADIEFESYLSNDYKCN